MTIVTQLTLTISFCFAASNSHAKQPCRLTPIPFKPTTMVVKAPDGQVEKDYPIKHGATGGYQLDTGDTPAKIRNTRTGKECTADVQIVTGDNDVWRVVGANSVLYRSYSGSERWLTHVELRTCKTLWKSRAHIGEKVENRRVTVMPDCGWCEESREFAGTCTCSSGEIWELDARCQFKLNGMASTALTKEELGVAFSGKKAVKNARSSNASLVE